MTSNTILGVKRRSALEKVISDLLLLQGVEVEYESTQLTYVQERTYTPDFILPNGIMIEVKGYLTPNDRSKILAVLTQNPSIDLRFIFERASNKFNAKSKNTYSSWCEKHKIKYAEGQIPREWLLE